MSSRNALPVVVMLALVAPVSCARLAGIDDDDDVGSPPVGSTESPDAPSTPGTAGGVRVEPESLAITTSCTGGDEPHYITLENQSDEDVTYDLEVPAGSPFALRDDADASTLSLTGNLPAKRVLLVYLRVTSPKAGTWSAPVIARVGNTTKQIPVSVTVTGGALALSPTLVDFGEVRQNTESNPQTIEVENTGTEAVNVIGFGAVGGDAGVDFDVTIGGGGSFNLAAGQKANATVKFVAGGAGPPIVTTFEPQTQAPTCGELPKLTLKGTHVNQDVTVNPVSLDFGDVACASPGGRQRTVTISNYGNAPVPYTVTAPAMAWFSATPANGTVPADTGTPGTAMVTVTLNPLGATLGSHTDSISIAVMGPQPKVTTVAATVKSVGAVLTITPTSLPQLASGESKSFTVKNDGNKFVYVRHQSSDANFTLKDTTSPLFPGLPLAVEVAFTPQSSGLFTTMISTTRTDTPPISLYPSSGALCETPPVVTVSGMK